MSNVLEVTDIDELRDLIDSEPNLVVKYWATWCGPCRMFKPAFEKAAEKVDATFVEVDVDKVPDVVVEFGVRGVPAVHQWRNGERNDIRERRLIPLIAELNA